VKRQNIVQCLILLVGIVLILVAMMYTTESQNNQINSMALNTILLSIGCSIIAVVIINFVDYHITLPEKEIMQFVNSWKLANIFETRQEMNQITNQLLKNVEELDIAALGSSGLLNHQGQVLKKRLSKGLKLRFLVPIGSSEFIIQREKDEKVMIGSIKKSIEDLIDWASETKKELNLNDSSIQIKEYSCLPIESMMIIDKHLFTGPFMVKKQSQLTNAYHYKKGGKGFDYYKNYFEDIWNDNKISSLIEDKK